MVIRIITRNQKPNDSSQLGLSLIASVTGSLLYYSTLYKSSSSSILRYMRFLLSKVASSNNIHRRTAALILHAAGAKGNSLPGGVIML